MRFLIISMLLLSMGLTNLQAEPVERRVVVLFTGYPISRDSGRGIECLKRKIDSHPEVGRTTISGVFGYDFPQTGPGSPLEFIRANYRPGTYLFSVGLEFVDELNRRVVSEALREHFRSRGRALTPPILVEVEQAGSRWRIFDVNTRFYIRNEDRMLNVHLETIVFIVGHSYGGNRARLLADQLRQENIPVAALVPIDPIDWNLCPPINLLAAVIITLNCTIPISNCRQAEFPYQAPPGVRLVGSFTQTRTRCLRGYTITHVGEESSTYNDPNVDHTDIDGDSWVHQSILDKLVYLCKYTPGRGPVELDPSAFQNAYNRAGGRPVLGCPVAPVQDSFTSYFRTSSHYQRFKRGGAIFDHHDGPHVGQAFAVVEPLYSRWAMVGLPDARNPLGLPIGDLSATSQARYTRTGFRSQRFEGGSIVWHQDGERRDQLFEVYDKIDTKWRRLGYADWFGGLPISDEFDAPRSPTARTGRVSVFEQGHIFWRRDDPEAFATHGDINRVYALMGSSGSWLGFPVTDQFVNACSRPQSNFENGYITTLDGTNFQAFRYECTYGIAPTSQPFGTAGGSGSVSVTAGCGCAWTASSNAGWITITSGGIGTGNGTVSYTVAVNTSPSLRIGTLTIARQTFTVIQDGAACAYSILPTSQSFGAGGGSGNVSVTAGSGCSWTASSNDDWIRITSGSSGIGNGTVNYTVAANTSGSSRTGTLLIAGRTFTVTQAGTACTSTILPTSQSFGGSGGGGNVRVTTQSGCLWQALSNVGWISITSGSSGSGDGTVTYLVAANSGPARTGTLTIANQTFTVTQAGTPSTYRLFAALRGSGTMTSNPPGISCPDDCYEDYLSGTQVTLTATPASGWRFTGWDGACSGLGACVVSMTVDRTAIAAFERTNPPRIGLSPTSFMFTSLLGEPSPPNQTLTITNIGGLVLNWNASTSPGWLSVSPRNGSLTSGASTPITVSVNTSGLPEGSHSGEILIEAPGAIGTPQTVPVTVVVIRSPAYGWGPLRTLGFGFGSIMTMRQVAYSPDGARLAIVGNTAIVIWNVGNAAVENVLAGHTGPIRSAAWSPDGSLIASGAEDRTIRIWDAETGQVRGILTGHTNWVASVAWSPDGSLIASGAEDSTLRIWDAQTGQLLRTIPHTDWVLTLAWSPDGTMLAFGSPDRTVRLWEASSGQVIEIPRDHTATIMSVAWSPDGKWIASGSQDRTIKIWDVAGRRLERTLTGHRYQVTAVTWSPNSQMIASGSYDGTGIVNLWNVSTGRVILTMTGHTDYALSVTWSPDGSTIASASYQEVIIWDALQGDRLITFTGGDSVSSVAWSPDAGRIAAGSRNNTIRIWDAQSAQPMGTPLTGHKSGVLSVAWSPDGTMIASGSRDATVKIWNVEFGLLIRIFTEPTAPVSAVAWSPDSTRVVAGCDDTFIRIWNVRTGRLIARLGGPPVGHTSHVLSVAWSRDGRYIVSGSRDSTIIIWKEDGGFERRLNGHTGAVYSVAWSPDSRLIASGGQDRTVKIWDAQSGVLLRTLTGHADEVLSVTWSPDGRMIASSSGNRDRTVKIWDAQNGQVLKTLTGHLDSVYSVAWSPDASAIASSSGDGAVRIWGARPSKIGLYPRSLTYTGVLGEPDPLSQTLEIANTGGGILNWTATATPGWLSVNPRNGTLLSDASGTIAVSVSMNGLPEGSHTGEIRIDAPGAVNTPQTIPVALTVIRSPLENFGSLSILGFGFGSVMTLSQVAYSPNGTRIAVAGTAGVVIWNTEQEAVENVLVGHTSGVRSVALSPDGGRVASGSADRTIKIWNAQTGALIRTLQGHTGTVLSLAWSPDDRLIASGSADSTIKIWDAQTGQFLRTIAHTDPVWSVAWSPDSRWIASGSDDRTVRIWEAGTGVLIRTLSGHTAPVQTVAWSPDGSMIASGAGGLDRTIKIWNAETWGLMHTLTGHGHWVESVAWSPDSGRIASGSQDTTLRIWDASTGEQLQMVIAHPSHTLSVTWSPDGGTIASSSYQEVKIWDASSGILIRTLTGNSISSVTWSPDATLIASGSQDKTVKVWDVFSAQVVRTLSGHTAPVLAVAWSPNGRMIASGSGGLDRTVKIWDAQTGAELRTLAGHGHWVESVAWSPDSSRITSGSDDTEIRIWDAQSGALIRRLTGHTSHVLSVAWSPDGSLIASASRDGTIRIWDASRGTQLLMLTGHMSAVLSVTWSPDSRLIASGAEDRTVKIWDAQAGRSIRTLRGHTDSVLSVAWSPDAFMIASSSADKTVKIWDAQTGLAIRHLTGHIDAINSVAWSPDAGALASGSGDGSVRLWGYR